jgi:DNA-binding transcriptional MerR regulator
MSMNTKRTYSIAAFAALAGVTPRALRHYDRLGLLTPTRSNTGYRRYVERDLEVLEEIIALKFIGVPLKQIAGILSRPNGRSRTCSAHNVRHSRPGAASWRERSTP